jgi:hypothetical protein
MRFQRGGWEIGVGERNTSYRENGGMTLSRISNAENIRNWESLPPQLIEGFGDEGDFPRQHHYPMRLPYRGNRRTTA